MYTNVLRRFGEDVPLLHSDRMKRWKARVGYCCPPQLARTVAMMHGYVYSTSDDALWVHLYGSNVLETELDDGSPIRLRQETQYPWIGDIPLTVESLTEKPPFALNLRIPQWAGGASIRINGKTADVEAAPGGYAVLRRHSSQGDDVELTLPMQPRLFQANPLIEETRGQVAVMRGPVVYCLESVDLPEGGTVTVDLPAGPEYKVGWWNPHQGRSGELAHESRIPGGRQTLTPRGRRQDSHRLRIGKTRCW